MTSKPRNREPARKVADLFYKRAKIRKELAKSPTYQIELFLDRLAEERQHWKEPR